MKVINKYLQRLADRIIDNIDKALMDNNPNKAIMLGAEGYMLNTFAFYINIELN